MSKAMTADDKAKKSCQATPHTIRQEDADHDRWLVERAMEGDQEAFGLLIKPHLGKLFKSIWSITKNREDAEDSMQETLLRASTRLEQFRGTARFSTWLFSIGINQALHFLRKRQSRVISLDTGDIEGDTSPLLYLEEISRNPEQQCINTEFAENLSKAIHSLPLNSTLHLNCALFRGFRTKRRQLFLGISLPAMKTRALRARLNVGKFLTKQWGSRSTRRTYGTLAGCSASLEHIPG